MNLSVVIPAYGEEAIINRTIDAVESLDGYSPSSVEIIVSDGHPAATTLGVIPDRDVIRLRASSGRARQMNAAARIAKGRIILFLHADSTPPRDALTLIEQVFIDPRVKAGAFELDILGRSFFFRLVSILTNLRSRIGRIPFGDQGQFFLASYFARIGGYRDIRLFEDVEIMKRMRKRGDRILILRSKMGTSPRRWLDEGMILCTLRNRLIAALYAMGADPDFLASMYGDVR